ncbi:MAG TPA: hypothetical protein VFM50_03495 [Nocardioidaceae bacterium]|nr:hypothetical protein [Nocardioidaceae bacterium]
MSDPSTDPFERLRALRRDTAAAHPALPASEVRRRGDRLRRRRHRLQAVGAGAAIVLAVSGGLLAGQQVLTGAPVPPSSPAPAAPPSSEAPASPTGGASAPAPTVTAPATPASPTGPASPSGGRSTGGTPGTPASPGHGGATLVTRIPPDLDLAAGMPAPGGEAGARATTDDPTTPWAFAPCQDASSTLRQQPRADFAEVRQQPAAGDLVHQLALYDSVGAAQGTLSAYFRKSLGLCSEYAEPGAQPTSRWRTLDASAPSVGADELIVAVEDTYEAGMQTTYATVYVVARADNAVLVVARGGEFAMDEAARDEAVRRARAAAGAILAGLAG